MPASTLIRPCLEMPTATEMGRMPVRSMASRISSAMLSGSLSRLMGDFILSIFEPRVSGMCFFSKRFNGFAFFN